MARRILLALTLSGVFAVAPVHAQWSTIFGGDPPPRPPGNVPSRPPAEQAPIPRGGLPPGPPPGRIQTQPLPPPPGAARAPSQQPPGTQQPGAPAPSPLPGLPPGVRQPPGTPQPANTAPQPGDEIILEPPTQKIANPTAVFSGLDKITGRIINFEIAINETVRFGALEVTPRVCYTRPPTLSPNTDGFIEVDELTLQGELRRIFTGWMFAASPGLNAIEHPIYDVWLTDCKGGAPPAVTAEVPPEPQPAAAPPSRTQQQRQQPRRVAPAPPPPPQAPSPVQQFPPPTIYR
jgi:hypothetical protein